MMHPRYIWPITILLLGLAPPFTAKQVSMDQPEKSRPAIEFVSGIGTPETKEPVSTAANTINVTVGPNISLSFNPNPVTILTGDTVHWTWGSSGHTVTSGPGCTADSAYCSPTDTNCSTANTSNIGDVYTHTFNQPGTFSYFCAIHCFSGMKGSVQVLTPFINISSLNNDITGFTINGQTTATTVHTTVTLTSTTDLTMGFGNSTPLTANASGAVTFTDASGGNQRFYRLSYP